MFGELLRFDGRVAIVTGAGGGLGRTYALLLGERGCNVVVNDLGSSRSGEGKASNAADAVVGEIKAKGGTAVADYNSVEDGDKIVRTALEAFGRIDILINNAGILRDRSFPRISDADWDIIQRVHVRGAFKTTQAAWPHFRKQQYGRIIMTSSAAGIFGNFGQANYSAAKMALIGLSNTLAIEGRKYDIHCNVIVPTAGSRLTEDIMPPDMLEQLKPTYVTPAVVWLCHESCPENGSVIEAAGGCYGKYQWARNKAALLRKSSDHVPTPEDLRDDWEKVTDMQNTTLPSSIQEVTGLFLETMTELSNSNASQDTSRTSALTQILSHEPPPLTFTYTPDDVILYALAVGVSTSQQDALKFLYENYEDFSAIPSFGVIIAQQCLTDALTGGWPGLDIDLSKVLHGEQYVELLRPLPTSGTIQSKSRIVDVLDKGSGTLLIIDVDSFDEAGTQIMRNQFGVFVVGLTGLSTKRQSETAVPLGNAPSRLPDATLSCSTSVDQAALYRLCGDKNPLHIDPSFAMISGFKKPILHGLCSFGMATRAILEHYAGSDVQQIQAIKVRFMKPVYPGQTLRIETWKDGSRIHFKAFVESSDPVLTGGYIDLRSGTAHL